MTLLCDDLEPILDFALRLHDLGFSITPPILINEKNPLMAWKPYQSVRATKKQLIEWAFEYPYFNYGVITGSLSGIVCLDADNSVAEAVIAKHCPSTPMLQVSGSGRGRHHLYKHAGAIHVPTRKNLKVHCEEVVGLDLRGDGGLFIGPGSLHCLTKMPYLEVEPWTKEMLAAVPVFDMAWLGLNAEPPRRTGEDVTLARNDIPLSRKQELARELLKGKAGSISGQGKAEDYCFALASSLVHGYDLTPDEAVDLLLEWGQKDSNRDANGNYDPWERLEIRHKLDDAASQDDPEGRPRGYLLPAWDQRGVEEVFGRSGPIEPYKSPVVVAELDSALPGPGDKVTRVFPGFAEPPPPEPVTEKQPALIDSDDPMRRFADDSRTAYLWKGHHANDKNVLPTERLARAKAVLEVYKLIPQTGLISDFLATYLPTTDCSCTLLLGAAMALGASLLNRRVWIKQGNKRLHPHLWCGLVAASGERKSTAVDLVASLLKRDAIYNSVCLVSDSTWPALAPKLGIEVKRGLNGEPDWLAARVYCEQQPDGWLKGVGTLCIDELGGWLKTLNSQVNQGLRETLTGMYESLPEISKETKTAGCYYIWRPCLTILAASTDTWLSENISESDLKGGFLGRWLFFVSNCQDYKLPRRDPPELDAERKLLAGIERLKSVSGEFGLSEQAWNEYSSWSRKLSVPQQLASFRSRWENAVLKIALIYEATLGIATVRAETLRLAMALVDWLASHTETFAEAKFVFDPAQKTIARVRQVLSAHNELSRSELLRLSHLTARQLDDALTTLFQTGQVVSEEVATKGRKGQVYRFVT